MKRYSNYHERMNQYHVWAIIAVKSWNHLIRKFLEFFAWFFVAYSFFSIDSFVNMAWVISAVDFAAILGIVALPLIISKPPNKIQAICQLFIGLSTLGLVWWNDFVGLFVLRFVFGICYALILSNW